MKTLIHAMGLAIVFLLAPMALAQGRGGSTLTSPQVMPDHQVTFRVRSPNAAQVSLSGEWLASSVAMTKDAQGVWSVTIGPLKPGILIYWFTVDGVNMADPVNPRMKLRASTSASLVEVPDEPLALWQARDVPHGNIQIIWEKSKVIGDTRAYYVYTPPGYDKDTTRHYPVLYLLHGSNDTAAGWTDVGKANFIEDSLLAENKAVPMIIVMPWGHAVPFTGPQNQNNELFEKYLVEEIIPSVDNRYRVAPGRENRAIVGLSMGGGQALQIGWDHLELFSQIGAFSFAEPRNFETTYKMLLDDPKGTNAKLTLMWMGVGLQDPRDGSNKRFAEMLTSHQIVNSFHEVEGRHEYSVWRELLAQMTPVLFRGDAKSPATQPSAVTPGK